MTGLSLSERRSWIEALVATHIEARVELVSSKTEIGGKLGRARWNVPNEIPLLQFPVFISEQEIEDCLLALACRGVMKDNPRLGQLADRIETPDEFLKHLVLHEIAHVKHDWRQDRETDCDMWVYEQMYPET